jgi:hypothetical protein
MFKKKLLTSHGDPIDDFFEFARHYYTQEGEEFCVELGWWVAAKCF